jgi:hypothetical protein
MMADPSGSEGRGRANVPTMKIIFAERRTRFKDSLHRKMVFSPPGDELSLHRRLGHLASLIGQIALQNASPLLNVPIITSLH